MALPIVNKKDPAYKIRRYIREDEWEINFENTTEFFQNRWKDANRFHGLDANDTAQADDARNRDKFHNYARVKQAEARTAAGLLDWKIEPLTRAMQYDRTLSMFESYLKNLVESEDESEMEPDSAVSVWVIDTSILWLLSYLNLKLAIDSKERLERTTKLMIDLKRSLDLANQAIRQSWDADQNTLRTEISELFDPVLGLLRYSITYQLRHYTDEEYEANWEASMEKRARDYLESIQATIKQLRDMSYTSKINNIQEARFAEATAVRDRVVPLDDGEKAIFPVENLPPFRAEHFTGRETNIKKIHDWIYVPEPTRLRTYLIYGRRGIGKTQIALEYARRFRDRYDAIFWVQCETRAAIRNSFTETAIKLEIEGAPNSHFEENLTRVLRWLKTTKKRWLLVYDNAEREQSLKGFWPVGARGSIILTSRSFQNFFEDDQRHGETVKVFTKDESMDLLMNTLGTEWENKHYVKGSMLYRVEQAAVETLLEKVGGLPLAVYQAAKVIKMLNNDEFPMDGSVRGFMEIFKRSYDNLPDRHFGPRDELIRSLDTIYWIAYKNLSPNAQAVLSVLALIAPDRILIDLFLPSDAHRLTDRLAFCRNAGISDVVLGAASSIQTVAHPSKQLADVFDELVQQGMVRRSGRDLSLHREVGEAVTSLLIKDDLRSSFEMCVNLVFDAFPKQTAGRPLSEDWEACRIWIQHAVQLAVKFERYNIGRAEALLDDTSSDLLNTLSELLANCAWFLYETADYDECLTLVTIATKYSQSSNLHVHAHLLNTAGCAYTEQNRLPRARECLEKALQIHAATTSEIHDDEADAETANCIANLGNVESAEGCYDEALAYFARSARIRENLGDEAAVLLALNYQQIGRVHFLQEEYATAYDWLQRSEGMLMKKIAKNRNFTAHLHFAYGNYFLAQEQFLDARRSFETTRRIIMDYNPLHPLCCAACYKLACVEFELNHHTKALGWIEKAFEIADIRSSGTIDGTMARILWKQTEIQLDQMLPDDMQKREEAQKLKLGMELKQMEIARDLGVELRGLEEMEDKEKSFDLLVPGYFR